MRKRHFSMGKFGGNIYRIAGVLSFLFLNFFFLYQVLWQLINNNLFQEAQIPQSHKAGFRLCVPTLPAL